MAYEVTMTVKSRDLAGLSDRVKLFSRAALGKSAQVVLGNVRDMTPRWKGGLVRSIKSEGRMGGDEQAVYATGPVARVHEFNGVWSKPPPVRPLIQWVVGKLGLSGRDAISAAYAIRHKIFTRGLTLPNREGRGQMFARTFALMQSSGFHMTAFTSALKQYLGGA
jgi:hypothetical protein